MKGVGLLNVLNVSGRFNLSVGEAPGSIKKQPILTCDTQTGREPCPTSPSLADKVWFPGANAPGVATPRLDPRIGEP